MTIGRETEKRGIDGDGDAPFRGEPDGPAVRHHGGVRSSPDTGWYSVRCVFHRDPPRGVYEERVTLWRTGSFDQAIIMAEREAAEYGSGGALRYLGLAQAYRLPDDVIEPGTEAFSLIRDSDLEPEEYLNAFFDTGDEHQEHVS